MRKVILINFALIAITLAFAELATRYAFGVPLFSGKNFIAERVDLIRTNSGVLVYDAALGWRLADDYGSGPSFSTGAYGLRMNGAERRIPLENQVIAVGDSFTAGSGVQNADTWPAQLEKLTGIPVYNGGAGAWGVDQIVLRTIYLIAVLRPRMALVGILADDSLRNVYSLYGGGPKPWFDPNGNLHNTPVPRTSSTTLDLDYVRAGLGHSLMVMKMAQTVGLEEQLISRGGRYKRIAPDEDGPRMSCAAMFSLAKTGTKIIVVMMYGAGTVRNPVPPWYATPVVQCAKDLGFIVVDMFDELHAIATDAAHFKTLWIDEGGQLGHPSAAGNMLIARQLQSMVTR